MITETFVLPTHWATALNYGDETGLENEDIEALNAFHHWMLAKYGGCRCLEVGSDRWFQRLHDATEYGILPCDVSEFTFDVTEDTDAEYLSH
jgi:hypothetical protein